MERVDSIRKSLRFVLGISLVAVLAGCYASGGVYEEDDWGGPGYIGGGYGPGYYRDHHDRDDYAFRGYDGRHGVHDADARGHASIGHGEGGHAESHGGGGGGHAGGGGGGGGHR
jgi:hypothetical protein